MKLPRLKFKFEFWQDWMDWFDKDVNWKSFGIVTLGFEVWLPTRQVEITLAVLGLGVEITIG